MNGGFEKTATNSIPYWNTTGTVAGNGGLYYEGRSCATLTVNSSTTTSSIYQYVSLDKGDYSLSMYINTHETQGVKVYLKAESMSNSAHSVVQEVPVNEYYATVSYAFFALNFSSSPSANNGKERFKISVVVSGAPTQEAEQIWVDNLMLSKTTGSAEYDMMSMGHFESTYYSAEGFWDILDNNDEPVTIVDSGIPAFGDVLKIDINVDEYEFVQQTVYKATDSMKSEYDEGNYYENDPMVFTVSGWGKGTAQGYADTSLFGIRIEIYYYDGGQYDKSEFYDFDFDKGITDWQFISGGFTTNPEKGMVSKITVMLMYNDHPGVGYFDSISLVQDSSTTNFYDYTKKGYLSSYKNGWNTTWYQYDNNNNVTCVVSTDKTYITYEYNSDNQLKKETHGKYTGLFRPSDGTIVNGTLTNIYYYSYGYNYYGQHYYTWTYDCADTNKQTVRFSEYNTSNGSHIFGTLKLEIDEHSKFTRYFYDENNGRLKAVLYPKGNGVCYMYDAIGNLEQVLPADVVTTEIYHEEYDEYEGRDYSWTETIYDYEADEFSASVSYEYNSVTNRLDTISTESTTYTFIYDAFGNTEQISIGDRILADYQYNAGNGKLNTLSYGNGLQVKYIYDVLDRISEIQYNIGENNAFETVYSYTYDTAGNIYSVTDHINRESTVFKYDSQGKLDKSYVYDTETYLNCYGNKVYYDSDSRVRMIFHYMDYSCPADKYHGTAYGNSLYYSYSYNKDNGNISELRISGDAISGTVRPQYDAFGRITQRVVDVNTNPKDDFYEYHRNDSFYDKWTYSYTDHSGRQTGQVNKLVKEIRMGENTALISSAEYRFTYDDNGNITQIADASGTVQYKYYYDDLGQLIREDNRALGYSYTYSYDNAGNILSKKRYAFSTGTLTGSGRTVSYLYEDSAWGDLLTEFSGYTIAYDDIGNPTHIGYCDGGYWNEHYELTWQGRQLMSYVYSEEGGEDISFAYNADGIRTKKVSNGVEHNYILNGSQILGERWEQGGIEYLLLYLYDENGSPIGLQYRTSNYASGIFDFYFFDKNLQGDVIGLYNSNGVKICNYTYNAWGVCEVSFTGSNTTDLERRVAYTYNPFRYRGYYYDTDTGLYYLQSRYYNPEWGRFLNADGYISTGTGMLGYNMFAYCINNPVNLIDEMGDMAVAATIAVTNWWNPLGWVAAGIVVVGVVALVAISVENTDNFGMDIYTVPIAQADLNISEASNSDSGSSTDSSTGKREGPIGKAGRKKQGREPNEKKKIGKGKKWVPRGNKDPNRSMKKHTPGKDHRHLLVPYINVDDEKNQYQIKWSM